jgi:hypothetical protein
MVFSPPLSPRRSAVDLPPPLLTAMPMTMMEFFRKSEGQWFTQRTVHHFDCSADESGESNLLIEILEPDGDRVAEIRDRLGLGSRAAGGASFNWQPNLSDRPPNSTYAAVLIDVPDDATGRTGRLMRDQGYVESIPVVSRYWFGDDGILTIDTDYENNQGQERCWFVTDNFRIRVSSVRMAGGVNLATYCSEFRCLSEEDLEAMVARNEALAAG